MCKTNPLCFCPGRVDKEDLHWTDRFRHDIRREIGLAVAREKYGERVIPFPTNAGVN